MRKIILIALGFIAVPVSAHAADDFGSRFSNTAPAALTETQSAPAAEAVAAQAAGEDAAAQELGAIAPAAGAEKPAEQVPAAEEITEEEPAPAKAPASTHDGYERDIENTNP
jgi:hypothetical protein